MPAPEDLEERSATLQASSRTSSVRVFDQLGGFTDAGDDAKLSSKLSKWFSTKVASARGNARRFSFGDWLTLTLPCLSWMKTYSVRAVSTSRISYTTSSRNPRRLPATFLSVSCVILFTPLTPVTCLDVHLFYFYDRLTTFTPAYHHVVGSEKHCQCPGPGCCIVTTRSVGAAHLHTELYSAKMCEGRKSLCHERSSVILTNGFTMLCLSCSC